MRLTPFSTVLSFTVSSNDTWTTAVDFVSDSLKHCFCFMTLSWLRKFSNVASFSSSCVPSNSDSNEPMSDLEEKIFSLSGRRSNCAHSTYQSLTVYTLNPSQFFHCSDRASFFCLILFTRQRVTLPILSVFNLELSLHIAWAPGYMRKHGLTFLFCEVTTCESLHVFVILSLVTQLTRVFPLLSSEVQL